MSSLQRIHIKGVRSYGHKARDRQTLEFCKPLTVIVGENGAGKTTVIESLRYATCTTGISPTEKRNLVHTPKDAGSDTVLGQIELEFKNKAGKPITVTRRFQATQKADGEGETKTSFKVLDGALKDDKGSHSYSAKKLDIMMVDYLGVSSTVLDIVIFCHQEQSCWPLTEGSLQVKFDDIFETTRFSEAVDSIKTLISSQKKDIDILTNTEIPVLEERKEKAVQYAARLEETKKELQKAISSMDSAIATLEENTLESRNTKQELERIRKLEYDIEKKETYRGQLESYINTTERAVGPVWRSLSELSRDLEIHRQKAARQKNYLELEDLPRTDVAMNSH